MAVPQRTQGWELEPFVDMSAAFVFFDDPVRLLVLDRMTWYILELCDGRSETEIIERIAELRGDTDQTAPVARIVDDRIGRLRSHRLLEDAA